MYKIRCRPSKSLNLGFHPGGAKWQHKSTTTTTLKGVVVAGTNNGHGFHLVLKCTQHAHTVGRATQWQR
jgi:hypothetical protein